MYDLLDPRNDFVFKRIFGSEENKDILLAFLNRTFMEAGEPPLTEIILMNPYTDNDSPRDKQSIFDIQARTAEGKLINVEMQLVRAVLPTTRAEMFDKGGAVYSYTSNFVSEWAGEVPA